MKKLLFIPLFLLSLLVGCKGGPGDTPDVPEQFDIDKINFEYEMYKGYEDCKGLELYRKISNDKEHYLFYIQNGIYTFATEIKVFYGDDKIGSIDYDLKINDETLEELEKKYFNLELNVEEPETFKDYTFEFEKLDNKINLIILPTIGFPKSISYENFIESDDYPLYYSDDEKDIHIGFTFKEGLLEPSCSGGVYNYTDLTNKNNAKYCDPRPFCDGRFLALAEYMSDSEAKTLIRNIIGLEYESFDNLWKDYNLEERILKKNEDIGTYNFRNPYFNETHYNYIKNHGTAFNISFDKLSFKGIYSESSEKYIGIGLIVNINSVELYGIDNEKYVPTQLKKEDYPELYDALSSDEEDIYIPLYCSFSPYENKILGWNNRIYCY